MKLTCEGRDVPNAWVLVDRDVTPGDELFDSQGAMVAAALETAPAGYVLAIVLDGWIAGDPLTVGWDWSERLPPIPDPDS